MTTASTEDVVVLLDAEEYLGSEGDRAERLLEVARSRHATRLTTALSVTAPSCADMLVALRARVGTEVGRIELRRAGASVMVEVDLLPRPTPAGDAATS